MFKYKKCIVILMILLASGCVSNPSKHKQTSTETTLAAAKNYKGLINYYRKKLKVTDSPSIRVKLAQAYLEYGDPSSSVFIISPINNSKPTIPSLVVEAKAHLMLGDDRSAMYFASLANRIDKNNGEVENILGIIYSNMGNYDKARHYFNLARMHFYDEEKVTNNLVVLDILQGDYSKAVKRIMPFYENGDADEQMTANLTIAAAKSGDLRLVEKILAPKLSQKDISRLYFTIKSMKGISLAQAKHKNVSAHLSPKKKEVSDETS
ncbi:hypothetical protein M9194_18155 [Vibrio sp. S4M6]|uniref:hypothetical protein n=1 Tax=Vibrio sinus TaxID=2946865 RepID=UPI00202A7FF5|nr:hypothetical protein [Vibrio sinus]MCL9783355.1 hypothetical protein [Vibrio sinus]